MTGSKGNSKFCFPETLDVFRGEAEGNVYIEVQGKQNSLFSAGPVINCFVIPPNSKLDKNCEEIFCLTPVSLQICRGFEKHDLITCDFRLLYP